MGDFYRTQSHTARKQHRCDACGEPIEPGDEYKVESGIFDGLWYRWKWCGRCRPHVDSRNAEDHWYTPEGWAEKQGVDIQKADVLEMEGKEMTHGRADICIYRARRVYPEGHPEAAWWTRWAVVDD